MTLISVDVEADGPIPGKYSMVSFGAVVVDERLNRTFYGQTRPISEEWVPQALSVSGHTRDEHLAFEDPELVMCRFSEWLSQVSDKRPIFISDNPAFDWQWINWYFHTYTGANPFGFSARRIGDLYSGMKRHMKQGSSWKRLRKTRHTHHPVDDAKGNAEALLQMFEIGLRR